MPGPTVDEEPEDEEKPNVWQQLLQKSLVKTSRQNTTLIVFGEKKNGKGSLLKKFKERRFNDSSQEYLLDYSYVDVKNAHDDQDPEEVHGRMNIWELDSVQKAEGLVPLCLKNMESTLCMITLDLSRPWDVKAHLDSWLAVLTKSIAQAMDILPPEKREELKGRISAYNQRFIDPSLQGDDQAGGKSAEEAKIDSNVPRINLGVPLVVVGTKGDALQEAFNTQTSVGDRFHFLAKQLRLVCLEYGATLVFTSAVGKTGDNVELLQEYIYHRLYGFQLTRNANPEGSETEFRIYIPSGFDTPALIDAVKPAKASWGDTPAWEDVFKNPVPPKKALNPNADAEITAQDNELFFKTLKFNLEREQGAPKTPRAKVDLGAVAAQPPPAAAAAAAEAPPPAAETPSPTAASAAQPSSPPNKGKKGQDQTAVKDFFRSLLSSGQKTGHADKGREQIRKQLEAAKQSK